MLTYATTICPLEFKRFKVVGVLIWAGEALLLYIHRFFQPKTMVQQGVLIVLKDKNIED